jgi:uncharacterized protein YqgC (DUF456 family)
MDILIYTLWWLLAIVIIAGGMIGTVYPLLPGPPMVLAGLWIAAWIDDFNRVGAFTLWILLILTLIALLLDFIAGALGAKRVRASRQAISGALLGATIGIFFGLPGLILGPFIGAAIGELSVHGGLGRATEVGIATWIGLILGVAAKLAICLAMLIWFIIVWI